MTYDVELQVVFTLKLEGDQKLLQYRLVVVVVKGGAVVGTGVHIAAFVLVVVDVDVAVIDEDVTVDVDVVATSEDLLEENTVMAKTTAVATIAAITSRHTINMMHFLLRDFIGLSSLSVTLTLALVLFVVISVLLIPRLRFQIFFHA
jgi:hypothetical protein